MADKVHTTTQSLVHDIKSGLHGIHGAGEALRGGAMEALDGVFHKKEGEAKDREIYDRGLAEMRGTEERFEAGHHHHEAPGGSGSGSVSGGSLGHVHHEPVEHGQGSHFSETHAKGPPPLPARSVGTDGDERMGAARAAWQEKH